jgi:hypothetical protein
MSDMHDAALEAAAWRVVKEQAAERESDAKARLDEGMEVGDSAAARWSGWNLAKASKAKGRTVVTVTDPAAFAAWVMERWPSEVVAVESIRAEYLPELIESIKAVSSHPGLYIERTATVNAAFRRELDDRAAERGALIDDDGEVCPYVEVSTGAPSVRVTFDRKVDRVAVVGAMLADNALAFAPAQEVEA